MTKRLKQDLYQDLIRAYPLDSTLGDENAIYDFLKLEFNNDDYEKDSLSADILLSALIRCRYPNQVHLVLTRATKALVKRKAGTTTAGYVRRLSKMDIPYQYKLNALNEYVEEHERQKFRIRLDLKITNNKNKDREGAELSSAIAMAESLIASTKYIYSIDAPNSKETEDAMLNLCHMKLIKYLFCTNKTSRFDLVWLVATRFDDVENMRRALHALNYLYKNIWNIDRNYKKDTPLGEVLDKAAERVELADITERTRERFYAGYDSYFKRNQDD